LGNGERPELKCLHKSFCSLLIESVLTNYHQLFREVSLFFPLPNRDLCANSSNRSYVHSQNTTSSPYSEDSEPSPFPLFLRVTHVVFLLRNHFSSELETEVNVILGLLIKFIGGETDPIEPRHGWLRVLAMRSYAGTAPLYASFPVHWLTGDHTIFETHMYVQDL
jgi:Guanine nucleotide exchange factor in Golgi transport N-terminal